MKKQSLSASPRSKTDFYFLAFLCLLTFSLLSACSSKAKKKTPGPEDKIYPVSVIKATFADIPELLEFKGNFIPSDKLDVKSEIEGKLISVSVNEGQSVSAGDPLVSLNPESIRLLLDKDQKELKEVEAKIEVGLSPPVPKDSRAEAPSENSSNRTEENSEEQADQPERESPPDEVGEEEHPPPPRRFAALPNPQVPPPAEMRNRPPENAEEILKANEASLDRIKADIALNEKKLEAANIVAGISGIVARKNVTEGSVVKEEDILLQIVKTDPVFLSVFIPKESISLLKKEDKMQVGIEELVNQNPNGEVVFVSPEPDPQTKNYEVRISLPNAQGKIKIGMKGSLSFPLHRNRKVVVIPLDAVISEGKDKYVYLMNKSMAKRVLVDLGSKLGDKIEVKKGIQEGDQVVLKGQSAFSHEQEFVQVDSVIP